MQSATAVVTVRCSKTQLSILQAEAKAAGITLSDFIRRASLRRRVPRPKSYLDSLTLHELSHLAVAIDLFVDESKDRELVVQQSTNRLRELLQRHIDRLTDK